MTKGQIADYLQTRTRLYMNEGFEPEVAIGKAGADLRAMRTAHADATLAKIKADLGI